MNHWATAPPDETHGSLFMLISDDEQWQTEANEQRRMKKKEEEEQPHSDAAHSHGAATAAVFQPAAAPFVFFKLFSGEPNEKSGFFYPETKAPDIQLCPRPRLHDSILLLLSSGEWSQTDGPFPPLALFCSL